MMTAGFFLYTNTWVSFKYLIGSVKKSVIFTWFQDFINSNVVTTVDTMTAPLSEVYFPSVVVCNINQVRESYFEEVVSNLDHNAISNVTLDVPLNGTHQQCKDMFIYSIVSNISATKEDSKQDQISRQAAPVFDTVAQCLKIWPKKFPNILKNERFFLKFSNSVRR